MHFLRISSHPSIPSPHPKAVRASASETDPPPKPKEIRVCVNRICRRKGSMETLQVLTDLAPPDITIKSCGCLGKCGIGPNAVMLPGAVFVSHLGTPARAAALLSSTCGGELGSWRKSLEALALKKRAEGEMEVANFSQAEVLLSQAIEIQPQGGIHVLYKDRAIARIAIGNVSDAIEDVKEALTLAPKYPEAYLIQGDAFLAIEQFDGAEESYSKALELDPSIRRSKSFKDRIAKLQEKFIITQ
ncbi:hypothetical protein DCAR_0622743 [Daucus carota subsp. sativus]|uniref:Uncharacterized protein n=1 Tax=Daucus carota subsp. sativus TaxID=79200 RepID=A0AAF0XBM4_DAUCS|nr:PREDICTED: RNA polymerase II-associated protein 3 [Daucus carota subsp. sativus]WOH03281.1 hypothetical protein DCAR_0622677 [Daucus carota subsp. sativus]WOH03346.1 hypothetical protein DCAR_0622743 [Daucus carota subsp. sativus]